MVTHFTNKFQKPHPFRKLFNRLYYFVFAPGLLLVGLPNRAQAQNQGSYMLPVTPNMVTQLSPGEPNSFKLFDRDTNSYWFTGWQHAQLPSVALLDLGAFFPVCKIRVFDGAGRPFLNVSGATELNGTFKRFISSEMFEYNKWRDYPVEEYIRYIHFEMINPQGERPIGEIEVYLGDGNDSLGPLTVSTPKLHTGEASKIAVNGFHWAPLDLLQPFSFYREYLHWEWMEAEKGKNRYEPSDRGNGFFDTHFAALKARQVKTVACINETPDWMTQGYPYSPNKKEFKPILPGESPLIPASYKQFARFLYQFASRYGRVSIPDVQLTVNTDPRWFEDLVLNTPKSGLDLVEYIEVWNEPDKTWSGPQAHFEPEEYAAMLSACYDGHEGRLGPGYGIKTADPSMKVVMGGLSNFDLPYIERMIQWCKTNRTDQKFPADITNFHHYCNKTSYLNGYLSTAISPVEDQLKEKLSALKLALKEKLPGKELWYSEFGYDTHPGSPQHAPAFGNYPADDVQALWLMQSYVEIIAAGIDKAFVYNIIDEPNPAAGVFQSSGVAFGESGAFSPKTAWYRIKDFVEQLNGLSYVGEFNLHPKAKTYQFKRADDSIVLIGWLNSGTGSSLKLKGQGGEITLNEWPQFIEFVLTD